MKNGTGWVTWSPLRVLCGVFLWVGLQGVSLAQPLTVTLPGGAVLEMVRIPGGTFTMGSPETEPDRAGVEGPQRPVTITRGFYLAKYELTQAQWESVMGTRPWAGKSYVQDDPDRPATYISWEDAQALIARISDSKEGVVYRLPTEAEWEYACRAGSGTPWFFGENENLLKDYAWYRANLSERTPRRVGLKRPNPWGLYDMYGNVWEWVQDWYGAYPEGAQTDPTGVQSGTDRIDRGGSFYDKTPHVRSAYRNHDEPSYRSADLGLRLLRQLP